MDSLAVKAAMPILATGILNNRLNNRSLRESQRGFTLLELLLVILIIGIILTFAALSIGRGNERHVEEEMRRLAGLIDLAAQEATLESHELAVQFSGNKYEFLTFADNKWQRITQDDTFRPRSLPEEMHLTVKIEGEPVNLATEVSQQTENALPRIYLLSSGEMTPFQLTLKDKTGGNIYLLNGNINGKVEMRVAERAASPLGTM